MKAINTITDSHIRLNEDIYEYLGNGYAIDKRTKEMIPTCSVEVPVDTRFTTPAKREMNREKRLERLEREELWSERRKQFKNGPSFYYISAERENDYYDLSPETLVRLIYLLTFLDYKEQLRHSNGRYIERDDLNDVLRLGNTSVYKFWNEVGGRFVFEDGKTKHLYVKDGTVFRGAINTHSRLQQVYIDTVRSLYRRTRPRQHKHLGYVFQMLPYINIEYNILCHNPTETNLEFIDPMTIDEFCDAIGYDRNNRARLQQTYSKITFPVYGEEEQFCAFVFNGGDMGDAKIMINPRIVYHGTKENETRILKVLCSFKKG